MKKKGILILLICFAFSVTTFAQGRKGLRINEVMVQNDSNYVDDYGMKHGWIELYNSTYGELKMASVYLTNDSTNKKMYAVPRGDVNTNIPPLQHVVFFADGEPNKGTFHISFTLKQGQDNWIGLYDADGKTLIDEVVVPANLPANQSYALKADGKSSPDGRFDPQFWEIRDGKSDSTYITPSSNNIIIDTNESIEKFVKHDPNGFVLTIMAMGIVFSALVVLSCCFFVFGKLNESAAKKNKAKAHADTIKEVVPDAISGDSGEEIAAISLALYEHLNAHDVEETVLTINKVRRAYSPWSSKIYTLTQTPRH